MQIRVEFARFFTEIRNQNAKLRARGARPMR
jgi:hypothetical protein